MDFVEKFNNYCDSIIHGKTITIPDKSLPQPVRNQEFIVNCQLMMLQLADNFKNEISIIEKQAFRENQALTVEQLKRMRYIAKTKTEAFIESAKYSFYRNY